MQAFNDYLRFLTLGLFATVVLCAPVACTAHRDMKVAEMVKAGADPQAAKCAMSTDPSSNPVCVMVANKGGK